MTIAFAGRATSPVTIRAVLGSTTGSGRAYVGVNTGVFGAGVGAVAPSPSGEDITDQDFVGQVTWDGSTVKLWKNGELVSSTPQNGSPNLTVAMNVLGINNAGSFSNPWRGRLFAILAIDRALTSGETAMVTAWLEGKAGL
jgi:hypothetical protein